MKTFIALLLAIGITAIFAKPYEQNPVLSLWYCPSRVRSLSDLSRFRECCIHPSIQQRVPGAAAYCCQNYGVCSGSGKYYIFI